MAETLIIGYGNPIRGDDRLGEVVIDHLTQRALAADLWCFHQLTPDLALRLVGYNRVVLVDARDGSPAGQIYTQQVQPTRTMPPLLHHLTPGLLLAVTQELYQHYPAVMLTGLLTTHFDLGAPLSARVEAALPDLLAHITRLVEG
ncbi:MAG: hydrogenase maturation protease [Chloroflexi bacterium]|nr:hydrogenase maturation protease [Chloroflexota bacterium]